MSVNTAGADPKKTSLSEQTLFLCFLYFNINWIALFFSSQPLHGLHACLSCFLLEYLEHITKKRTYRVSEDLQMLFFFFVCFLCKLYLFCDFFFLHLEAFIFWYSLSLSSGICRWPDGEEYPTKALWEVCVHGTHWRRHSVCSSRPHCQRYVCFSFVTPPVIMKHCLWNYYFFFRLAVQRKMC